MKTLSTLVEMKVSLLAHQSSTQTSTEEVGYHEQRNTGKTVHRLTSARRCKASSTPSRPPLIGFARVQTGRSAELSLGGQTDPGWGQTTFAAS